MSQPVDFNQAGGVLASFPEVQKEGEDPVLIGLEAPADSLETVPARGDLARFTRLTRLDPTVQPGTIRLFSDDPGSSSSVGSSVTPPAELGRYERLLQSGIRTHADFTLFLELLKTLGTIDFSGFPPEVKQLAHYLSEMGKLFTGREIPVHFEAEGETSSCKRNGTEWGRRETAPAREFGIHLSRGASLYTAFHEMTHALPANDIFKLLTELFPDISRKPLEFPELPQRKDPHEEVFAKLAGRQFRDEAYSGISEILWHRFSRLLGLPVRVDPLLDEGETLLFEIGLTSYVNAGTYLGDNHLLLYNISTIHQMTDGLAAKPELIQGMTFTDLPESAGDLGRLFKPADFHSLLKKKRREILAMLYEIHHDPNSLNPLKPGIARLYPLIGRWVEEAGERTGKRKPVVKVDLPPPTIARSAGHPETLGRNPDVLRTQLQILGPFARMTSAQYYHLIQSDDFGPLAALALTIDDPLLPDYLGEVLGGINTKDDAASAIPLIGLLLAHGYHDQAFDIHRRSQESDLLNKLWVSFLFNTLEQLIRLEAWHAIPTWVDSLLAISKDDFSEPWRSDILEAVKARGRFSKKGEEKFSAELKKLKGAELDPQKVFEAVFARMRAREYSTENLKISKVAKDLLTGRVGDLKDYVEGEIEDAYDLQEVWSGAGDVSFVYDDYLKMYPSLEQIKFIADTAYDLKRRGIDEAGDKLEELVVLLVPRIIRLQRDAVSYRIRKAYGSKFASPRYSFLQHLERLGRAENEFLPTTPVLMKEALALATLSENFGGGWPGLLNFLRAFPDSFIKTWLCLRLSEEMELLPKPTEDQLAEFVLTIWKPSLEATLPLVAKNGFYEPDENGYMADRDVRGIIQTALPPGVLRPRQTDVELSHYAQINRSGMLRLLGDNPSLPAVGQTDRGGLIVNLQMSPLRLDPLDPQSSLIDRSGRLKHVLVRWHDPHFEPMSIEVEKVCKGSSIPEIRTLLVSLLKIIEALPPVYQASYIPLLLQLSLRSVELGEELLADYIYNEAFKISKKLADVQERELGQTLFYVNVSQAEQKFDLGSRFREVKVSWERGSLLYLIHRYQRADDFRQRHRLSREISTIAENESIFDTLESKDYRSAAEVLDATGEQEELVIRLLERAIQCKLREEYEKNYDFDWKLIKAVDLSGLPVEEKDRLLALTMKQTMNRAVAPWMKNLAGLTESSQEKMLDARDQALRMMRPFHALMDLVEERGYLTTEGVLWEGLQELSSHIQVAIPESLQPVLLEVIAGGAILRNPALVHPANRSLLERGDESEVHRSQVADLFDSFSTAQKTAYPGLPSIRDIQGERRGKSVDSKILSHFPKKGEIVDPYLIDLYRADYLRAAEYDILSSHHATLVAKHYGYKTGRRFFKDQPELAVRLFLSRLSRTQVVDRIPSLIGLVNSNLPIRVRTSAFALLIQAGLISRYITIKFDQVMKQTESAQENFFADLERTWVNPDEFDIDLTYSLLAPDWLLVPLFEPVLDGEKENLLHALELGRELKQMEDIVGSEKDNYVAGSAYSLYDLIVFLLTEYDFSILRGFEKDPEWMVRRIKADIHEFIEHTEDAFITRKEAEIELPRLIARNRMLVRTNQVRLPRALEAIHPTLKLVIADYIALAAPQTRLMILSALSQTETQQGEEAVLKKFFEVTGLEKLAQFLSQQKGIVPENYRWQLESFQEDLRPSTLKEVQDTLKAGFGDVYKEWFESTDFEFVHAGTVGEIWKGILKDGREVAIKVLPRKKRQKNVASIKVLERLAHDLNLFRHELFGGINFVSLYEQYRDTIMGEMNYYGEVENFGQLKESLAGHGIRSPEYLTEHVRENVLIMEFLPLISLRDVKDRLVAASILEKTGKQLARSIFLEGSFYEDYHGGNIKWLEGVGTVSQGTVSQGVPVILDFGRIGIMTLPQRTALIQFLMSVVQNDSSAVMTSLNGMTSNGWKWESGDQGKIQEILESPGRNAQKIQDLFALVARRGGALHPPYTQFLKSVVSWEGAMRQMVPEADFSPFAAEAIIEYSSPPAEPEPGIIGSGPDAEKQAPSGGSGLEEDAPEEEWISEGEEVVDRDEATEQDAEPVEKSEASSPLSQDSFHGPLAVNLHQPRVRVNLLTRIGR